MHPFGRILVYASFEDGAFVALDQAASLARAHPASITVMRILEDGGAWKRLRTGPERLRRLLEDEQRELIEERLGPLRDEGLDVRVEVRWGKPWLELVYAVLRDGYDLVVKRAEGATRSHGLFFGSTAMHLIRKCPCPVWVVGSAEAAEGRRVLAALDPTDDEVRSALAQRVLNLAASMAGDDGELHAVAAWLPEGEALLRERVRPEEFEDYAREAREGARASLDGILARARHPAPPAGVHLLKGDARDVLVRLVEREDFDLLVMGSLGQVGIAGLLIGSTAETVIRSVRCAVLVVKPPGFVSPVELPGPG